MYIINIVNILINLQNLKPIQMLFDFLINKKARNKVTVQIHVRGFYLI